MKGEPITIRRSLKAPYRQLENPRRFQDFLQGQGLLSNREQVAEQYDYDWHSRKLSFTEHFNGHVLMQATAYQSARDHQWAAENDPLFAAGNADVDISVSGLAQANRKRPIAPLYQLLRQVMAAVGDLPHRRLRALDKETWQGIVHLLGRTDLFDATTLQLPPKLRDWAPSTGDKGAALKLHLRVAADSGAMHHIQLSPAPGSDSPYFDDMLGDLTEQNDQIYVFDGGYWDIATYERIVDTHNHFVTKRGGNIQPQVIEEHPVPDGPLDSGYEVLQDARVYLGDSQARQYRMLHVQLTTDEDIVLLTSLLDLPADHICLLYRYRWSIEIIFRWLKQRLQLDHFMSHDPVGILRQILMALLVWSLLVLYNQDPDQLRPKNLWRQMQADLHQMILEYGYQLGQQGAPPP